MLYCIGILQTNFEYRLLYDIHDFPCSTFKIFYQHGGTMWHVVRQNNFAHGSLGHAIKHGQVKGCHMTLNVQHLKYNLINLGGNHVS